MVRLDAIAWHARHHPGRPALHDLGSGRRWSYGQADAAIARAAGALAQRGVGPGERVATYAKNSADIVLLHFACARRGALLAPYNWRLCGRELSTLSALAEPALTLIDEDLPDCGLNGVSLDAWRAQVEGSAPDSDTVSAGAADSLLLFTSGTTGQPKGVVLNEGHLAATARHFALLGDVDKRSVFLCDAPMFHIIGLVANIRPVLGQGGQVLVSDRFDPERTLHRLSDPNLGVSHYFCVPQMAKALRAETAFAPAGLASLKALFTGGAPHAPADIEAWLDDGIAAVDGYGLSETGSITGMPLDLGTIRRRAGAVGLPPPGVAVAIVDSAGQRAARGVPGQIYVRGPNVFSRYWRDPAATRAAFTADGWFKTGDLGAIDREGYLSLIGRHKDLFISGGENVYPAEIENALAGHPQVADCALVGRPDARWGEVGHLFVAPERGANAQAAALLQHLEERLARYKVPKFVTFIDIMPRNAAGKLHKAALRRRAQAEARAGAQGAKE